MNTQWAGQITIWGFLEKSWRLPWKYFITNLTFERFPFMINCNVYFIQSDKGKYCACVICDKTKRSSVHVFQKIICVQYVHVWQRITLVRYVHDFLRFLQFSHFYDKVYTYMAAFWHKQITHHISYKQKWKGIVILKKSRRK